MELFIDIETIARPGAEVLLPEVKAAGNLKDPEKITNDIAKKQAKQLADMALDKRTCEIVTIGWAVASGPPHCVDADPLGSEAAALRHFWWTVGTIGATRIIGFNIYNFDLPIIMRRSCLLGITPTVMWESRKYQHHSVLDLMQEWVGWDGYVSLKDVCRECGIPEPEGDGADVATMSPEERIAHCKSDVEATRALYYKGKGWYW